MDMLSTEEAGLSYEREMEEFGRSVLQEVRTRTVVRELNVDKRLCR